MCYVEALIQQLKNGKLHRYVIINSTRLQHPELQDGQIKRESSLSIEKAAGQELHTFTDFSNLGGNIID